jgi:hypothetical protein
VYLVAFVRFDPNTIPAAKAAAIARVPKPYWLDPRVSTNTAAKAAAMSNAWRWRLLIDVAIPWVPTLPSVSSCLDCWDPNKPDSKAAVLAISWVPSSACLDRWDSIKIVAKAGYLTVLFM